MQSLQSLTVKTIINLVRSSLFVHKTDALTVRVGFERVANLMKFPRFVSRKETKVAGIPCCWFTPDGHGKSKVILYFPGGGYVCGSYNTHRALIARIARSSGYKVLAVDYRKAPEDPYPAATDDALAVYKQLLRDGYDNIVLMGDSAGGGLVLALLQIIRQQKLRNAIGAVLLSPWTDLTLSGETMQSNKEVDPFIKPNLVEIFAKRYYVNNDPENPLISPHFADVSGFPPTLIHVGSHETLLDDSVRMAKKMSEAKVEVKLSVYKDMIHVWHFLGGIMPEANQAIQEIGEFVKSIKVNKKTAHLDALAVY